jgi:hypothetical protein
MNTLKHCSTLINIEGTVYKLSDEDYRYFKDNLHSAFIHSNAKYVSDSNDNWATLLHWVQEHGEFICNVETYNF